MPFFLRKQRGASTVEYGLFIGLIAILLISSVSAIGSNLSQLFGVTEDAMGNAVEDAAGTPTSCADIQKNRPGAASGEYTITPEGSGSITVYCDMDTAGGPWIRVTYHEASENPAAISGFSSGGVTLTTDHNVILLPAGWYTPLSWSSSNVARAATITSTPPVAWTQAHIELSGLVYTTPDGFNNTATTLPASNYTSIEGQYVDGYSLTYGAAGSRHHIYTVAATRAEVVGTPPSFIGSDYMQVSSDEVEWDAGTFSKTVSVSKASGTEPVELRLMLDQGSSDESLGLTHYVVLLK